MTDAIRPELLDAQHPLRVELTMLRRAVSDSYTSAFPNPRNPVYARYLAAERALSAFEAAHPEVVAAAKADSAAKRAAKATAKPEPGSLMDRIERGVD